MTETVKSIAIAGAVSVLLAMLGGAVLSVQIAFGLTRFGGTEYVPRVVALSLCRLNAPALAAGFACFLRTGYFHGRHGAQSKAISRTRVAVCAVFIPIVTVFPLGCAAMLGSMLVLRAYGITMRFFLRDAATVVTLTDLLHGLLVCVAFGIIPCLWSLFGGRIWGTERRFASKLFRTWLVLSALGVGVTAVFRVFGE